MTSEDYMDLAIAQARQAIAAGQLPVGAVLVRDGRVIAATHNTVIRDIDPSAHAEMNAIRQSALLLRNYQLTGATIYVTLEPCPMCLTACHWARVERIVYGAPQAVSVQAGFSEMVIPASELVERGRSPLKVEALPTMRDTCAGLFAEWQAAGLSKPY
jgi:tRNA(Arg) A34 adenosine deaminase TadA